MHRNICLRPVVALLGFFLIAHAVVGLAQEGPKLPDGVILVKLPPGEMRKENIIRNGKPILRVTVGKTIIETRELFLGDGKGAIQIEAIKEGMHWVPASGGKGFIFDGSDTSAPGSEIHMEHFLPVEKLKPGSLYITTPSIIFRWGKDAKRPKQ